MKKLLLMLLGGVLFATPTFAQEEEDVTKYIANAGFDEDLTFQANGTMKDIVKNDESLSDRSWAYIAADSTVYAKPKSTSSQQRKDGRSKLDAVNGFIGRVAGWQIETNQVFPKCEWVYFGTVPYALDPQAVPIADDGDTYLLVPAKPADFATEDNTGFAYLRAGWGGRAVYKQVVKLPCAKYRLEYWAININPNGKNGKNLSKVTCRKDVFADETGFSDTEWTLHQIEFTPTSEFTIEFGFESSGGSNSNPFLCIDGIKLYKIGDADPLEILEADLNDAADECGLLASDAANAGFNSLSALLSDYSMEIVDFTGGDQETMEAGLKEANAKIAEYKKVLAEAENINAVLAKMDKLLQTTNFKGKAEFEATYMRLLNLKENDNPDALPENLVEKMLNIVAEGNQAIKDYYMTQEGSVENPADFTIFIQNPWFINTAAEPTFEDEGWFFPNALKEDGTSNYTEGSASSPDLNSTGWYVAGASGGDQRLNWQRGRSCWNAWNNNYTTTLAVAQDITGIPNGYYTVSADLITQSGCNNSTQRVFAQSTAEKKTSTATLTTEGWDESLWETVSMTAEDKVLVVDNKITIGAEGTGSGEGATGWFLATNFHLYYLGEAPVEALKEAFDAKVIAAKEMVDKITFNADRVAINDSIAKFAAYDNYVEGLAGLAATIADAQKSINKYEEYVPSDGTIDGKTIPTVQTTLKKNGGEGYGAAEEIVEFAYNYVTNWVKGDTATYTKFDEVVNVLKNYLNTYTPVYNKAAEVSAAASAAGQEALNGLMEEQKKAMVAEVIDLNTINEFVKTLNTVINMVEKRNIYDDKNATDYTLFIKNPNAEATDGWDFVMGNGDGNGQKSGQWFDDSSTRYFDSYNGEGLKGFSAMQLIKELPNGTYKVGVYTRTPAEGAYICYAVGSDTTFVEIPLNYYTYANAETGEDTTVVASDKYGPIWEECKAAQEAGNATSEQLAIYNANSGQGRGWKHQEMDNIVVTNHELLIGTMAGTEASKTEKVFAGGWYSVGGWTLTLVSMGDNSGWEGPVVSGIQNMKAELQMPDGIYTIAGAKTNKLQRGLNIVISNGKARKVLVK